MSIRLQYVQRAREYSLLKMAEQEKIIVEGKVLQVLPNTTFRVELEGGQKVLAHLSGKMRIHFIKIVPGDKVRLELSPYDLTKGRVIYRL